MTRAANAALFGSHFEDWKRSVGAPVWIPRRWSALRPPSRSAIANVVDHPDHQKAPQRNRIIGYLYKSDRRVMEKELVDRRFQKWVDRAALDACADEGCKCCLGWHAAECAHAEKPEIVLASAMNLESFQAVSSSRPTPLVRLERHTSRLTFDPDTWITTAYEKAVFRLAGDANQIAQRVERVFRSASPENWASTSELVDNETQFFVCSIPFRKGEPAQVEASKNPYAPPLPEWATSTGGELLEVTKWDWSFDSQGGAEIVLTIKNYDWQAKDGITTFRYDYCLHHCERYDFGPTPYSDILDLDGGFYLGQFDANERLLSIEAEKSVHFRAPVNDEDVAMMLNLMAPALTGMLMQDLVLEGAQKILRGPPKQSTQGRRVAHGE